RLLGWGDGMLASVAASAPGSLALIAGASAFFAWIFHSPESLVAVLARRTEHPRELPSSALEAGQVSAPTIGAACRRAVLVATLLVVVMLLLRQASARVGGVELNLIAVLVVTAVLYDVIAEWRARRRLGDLVPVWRLHRPWEAAIAVAALDA